MDDKKSRYISFKELKEDYTLAEIFEFLQAGLQPLSDPSLSPIPCPEEHHVYAINKSVINFLYDESSGSEHGSDNIFSLKEENKQIEAEDPFCESWKYFVPPVDESENIKIKINDPLLNRLERFLPQDREPENKELNDVVSILSKAIFEIKQLDLIRESQKKLNSLNNHKLKNKTLVQQCKIDCRKRAEKLWKEDLTLTIPAMYNHPEIKKIRGDKYTEKTFRKWVKDLNPNPKPGRRPTKSK